MQSPTIITINAGTTFSLRRDLAQYPASAGWRYQLVAQVPGYTPVDAATDGDAHVFTLDAATTAALTPGRYRFSERMSLDGVVREAGYGYLRVTANLAAAGLDGRSHAERTLAIIEAALEGRLIDGIENYTIAGRAVSKIPAATLAQLHDRYRVMVAAERGCFKPRQVTFGE